MSPSTNDDIPIDDPMTGTDIPTDEEAGDDFIFGGTFNTPTPAQTATKPKTMTPPSPADPYLWSSVFAKSEHQHQGGNFIDIQKYW